MLVQYSKPILKSKNKLLKLPVAVGETLSYILSIKKPKNRSRFMQQGSLRLRLVSRSTLFWITFKASKLTHDNATHKPPSQKIGTPKWQTFLLG